MHFKTMVFLIIVGIVFNILGHFFWIFRLLAGIAFCFVGISFIVWLYKKFFSKKEAQK